LLNLSYTSESRIKLTCNGNLIPIGGRYVSFYSFGIVGYHDTYVSYNLPPIGQFFISIGTDIIGAFVYKWIGAKNNKESQKWDVISYSYLRNKPIIKSNNDILFVDHYANNYGLHWNIFRLNNSFQFKEGFESIPFPAFGYEIFIGNLNNKAAFIGLLQSYDISERGCNNVSISSYDGCIYSYTKYTNFWYSLTNEDYQLYFYDIMINVIDITSTIQVKSTTKQLSVCELT